MHLDDARSFLVELAEASAREILPHFGQKNVGVLEKSDSSPVTIADREAERVMREMIEHRFPDHGIVGEEFGTVRGEAEFTWVLDPIDGTKSFISAVPLFGTLIGLLHRGRPVLGCIHQPVLRQLMIGDGETTTLNGQPVRGRNCTDLSQATLLMSDPMHPAIYQDGARFESVCRRAKVVRSWGDCYGYLLLAAGWADVMLDPIMNPWDLQPIVPIIRGAGGIITDWKGGSADGLAASSGIAAMPGLHAEIVRSLNPG